MKHFIILCLGILLSTSAFSASRDDVFDELVEVTWLGVDFTHMKFIGDAAQWQDVGEITNSEMRNKYFVSWNELFENEPDKYDVAKAISRANIKYALDVTGAANNADDDGKNYFTDNAEAYYGLSKDKIQKYVQSYNFRGNKGIGMMFFMEAMYKDKKSGSMWVAFVDMDNKKLLFTERVEGNSGGFGFRNYWAKSLYNGLKDVGDNWKKWRKQ